MYSWMSNPALLRNGFLNTLRGNVGVLFEGKLGKKTGGLQTWAAGERGLSGALSAGDVTPEVLPEEEHG